ncbi:dnaJ homolog subfamily C member 28 [Achroia grisella]|uniref:dnaJ homolog subfamily C member 28 n=1 Tax=Achroia grisella TaxID=688607 RepID=UPI0027D24DB7|nr:dnaJ homolog subfamily C member 28 [Achroia grisella]
MGISSNTVLYFNQIRPKKYNYNVFIRKFTSIAQKKLEECYYILNIPLNSKQDVIRQAFLDLAKKYHPDSGSPDADMDKFVAVENAFRTLTKHNNGNMEEADKIVYDIRHTAPQHRQYLSFEGIGYGTPFQRQKQWAQTKAQRAASNVMEHRMSKAVASENTLMKKGQYGQKHDIKTKYGFDRLVEDLIQESMSKGEFENLSGKGKPLKDQNTNPYVDFTTHKLNEMLINNGFTPEWITMAKEIDEDIEALKMEVKRDRMSLGPHPLNVTEEAKWKELCDSNRDLAKSINNKINTYNLIVPLINKQKFHVEIDSIFEDVLKNGVDSTNKPIEDKKADVKNSVIVDNNEDFFGTFFKALGELLTFKKEKKQC